MRYVLLAGQDAAKPAGDVGIVVESENRIRLGQGLGQLVAVAFGHASHGDDGLGRARFLEVGGRE